MKLVHGAVWVLALAIWGAFPGEVEGVIVINEILADPPAVVGDANQDGTASTSQDEFVELANTEGSSVSLAGWSLGDAVKTRHVFSVDALIPGFGFFTVFGGGDSSAFTYASTASTGSLGLNNSGDSVFLWDDQSALVDSHAYGSEAGKDVSLSRSPDGSGSFEPHDQVGNGAYSPNTTLNGESALAQLPIIEEPEVKTSPDVLEIPENIPEPSSIPTVPEPSSLLLLGLGMLHLRRML